MTGNIKKGRECMTADIGRFYRVVDEPRKDTKIRPIFILKDRRKG